jgi:hypothetical protein
MIQNKAVAAEQARDRLGALLNSPELLPLICGRTGWGIGVVLGRDHSAVERAAQHAHDLHSQGILNEKPNATLNTTPPRALVSSRRFLHHGLRE